MTEPIIQDRYLGDGVYASFDGWHVWLDLRGSGDSRKLIALEPTVMEALQRYYSDAHRKRVKPDDHDQKDEGG
jgi:hypothetical protein